MRSTFCSLPTNAPDDPHLRRRPARDRGRAAPRPVGPRRRDDRGDRRRGAGLCAGDGGRVRQGRPARRRDRLPALPGPRAEPGGGRAQRPRHLRQPRPRRVPRGPQPRRAAGRLPRRRAAGVAAVRRDRAGGGPRPRGALRPRRGDLRLHRRDLRRVRGRLRAGAVGGRGRGASAAGGGWCALLADDPPASEEAIRTVAAAAGWALPRRVAALVVGGGDGAPEDELDAEAAALARRVGTAPSAPPSTAALCVFVPDPSAPGRRRALETALAGARGALGPAVPWPRASASLRRAALGARARPRRARRRRGPPRDAAAGRRPRPRPPSWPRPGSLRSRVWRAGSASAWSRRCAPGWTARARSRRSPRRSTCTRRPSATA